MKRWIKGMRDAFFNNLFKAAKKDKDILLLTADTGAICHDQFKKELPQQYVNVGIAEQNMIGLAAGLVLAGKIVYVYGIIPFVTMRCYEQIRIDLCCMNLAVNIIGIGAGLDYSTLGATHHATEDIALMRALPQMTIYSPADSLTAGTLAKRNYEQTGPVYIRLDRTGLPLVYKSEKDIDFGKGFSVFGQDKDLYIIATGRMVYIALQVVKKMCFKSISAGVIDLFRIKPLNAGMLWDAIKKAKYIVALEEHFVNGGIGDMLAALLAIKKNHPRFKAMGIPDKFCSKYGTREYLLSLFELNVDSIAFNIENWVFNKN